MQVAPVFFFFFLKKPPPPKSTPLPHPAPLPISPPPGPRDGGPAPAPPAEHSRHAAVVCGGQHGIGDHHQQRRRKCAQCAGQHSCRQWHHGVQHHLPRRPRTLCQLHDHLDRPLRGKPHRPPPPRHPNGGH